MVSGIVVTGLAVGCYYVSPCADAVSAAALGVAGIADKGWNTLFANKAESPEASLRKQLDTGKGDWELEGSPVVEPADSDAKIYRGGVSVTERYRNRKTDQELIRHRLYGPDGRFHGHDTIKPP